MKLLLTSIFILASCKVVLANSNNPPNGYHGESINCTSCHGGNSVNSGNGGISLTGLPLHYTPGQIYDLSLIVSGTNTNGYGFQLIPKVNDNVSGSLAAISNDMAIENSSAEHRGTSSSGTWNFQWTAPATDQGTITFYASGLATGGSSGNDGDYVYTLNQQIEPTRFTHASMEWNASTGGVIFSSPAIGSDGTIYIGSNDNKLHAFNSNGSSKWTFLAGNWIDSTPTIGADGTIYVGSWDNKLYAINPDSGAKIWEYETNSNIISSPAVGADGKIYVGSKDSIFYAFENNGSIAWEYFAGQPITSSAALGQDGTIYFGDENGTFHAVNSDGSSKWTYDVDDVTDSNNSILSSPSLDLYGNIYFGAGNGYCYSLSDNDTNASLNWKFLTGDRVDASPVLGINDEIFFVSRDGYLRSLSTISGGLNWEEFVGDVFYSSPVVDLNGRAYVIGYTGGGENHLSVFDANGTKAWDTNDTDSPFDIGGIVDSSLVLSETGKLYYGCYDSNLYCLNVGVGSAQSDWPMFQRSDKRDGAWPSYTLEIIVSGTEGIVTGTGIYNPGSSVTISANPQPGYSFVTWSGTGPTDPSSSTTTIEMSQDRNITAVFEQNSYMVSTSVLPVNNAEISGAGSYLHGSTATLSVTAISPGFIFKSWTGDATGSDNPITIMVNEDVNITANLEQISLELNVTAGPGGTVTGGGQILYGSLSAIVATPSNGYSFVGWTGEGVTETSAPSTTVNMTQARSVIANFTLQNFTISGSITPDGIGQISGLGDYDYGQTATLTATATASGYSFSNWSGDANGSENPLNITIDSNMTIEANFTVDTYRLSLEAEAGGTVSGAGNFSYDTLVDILAIPSTGYSFTGWTGNGISDSGAALTSVSMTTDRNITAQFSLNAYPLTLLAGNGGTVTGEGNFTHGQVATITATPNTGYSFSHWRGDNVSNFSSPTTTVDMNQSRSVSAMFLINQYDLLLTSSSGGSTSGEGIYSHGQQAVINAIPNEGFMFTNWGGDTENNATDQSTIVTMDRSKSVHANFVIIPADNVVLTISTDPVSSGTTQGSGAYSVDSIIEISASPLIGYEFISWSGEGVLDSNSSITQVPVKENLTITANFQKKTYTLQINDSNGGTTLGAGTYEYDTDANISATAQPGYTFSGWTGDGVYSPSNQQSKVLMVEDRSIQANFKIQNRTLTLPPPTGGTVSGSGTYAYGTFVEIIATPLPGYTFEKWVGSTIKSPSASFTSVELTTDINITASFSRNVYSLQTNATVGGSVSTGGTYYYGYNASLSANASEGYKFEKWEGEGITSPYSPFTTISIIDDRNVTALFSVKSIAENLTGTTEVAPDWFSSTWFGIFFQNDSGWAYHLDFGWIYPVVKDTKNIWFWHNTHGWIWVAEETFDDAFLWSENSEAWLFWEVLNSGEPRYYDYSILEWKEWSG